MPPDANNPSILDAPAQAGSATPAAKPPEEAIYPDGPAKPDSATERAEPPKEGEAPKPSEIKVEDFKLPEGVELDKERIGEFKDFAVEAGLSQERAQKLLDMHLAEVQKIQKEVSEAPMRLWEDQNKKWRDEVMADKELGGDNIASVKATVAKALDQYGDPGIREALDMTGGGNNPAIVRTFYRMAKALTEGQPGPQGQPAMPAKTAAAAMYPNLTQE